MCDTLRDKRLRFGIKTFTEYFFGRSDTLYFFTDALVLSNPPDVLDKR